MSTPVPILDTERLVLRAFRSADAPRVRELAGAREVADLMFTIPHPYPEGAAESWIENHLEWAEQGLGYNWAVTLRSDGMLLGCVALGLTSHHERGELGYWLGVPYWGKGYASEAVSVVVGYGFGSLKLHRIEAMCYPRNRASARVLEKVGFAYEGRLRGYLRRGERFEDVLMYAALNPAAR